MNEKYNLAIVGATGNVGREIITILEEVGFPMENLYLLASTKSKGKKINFKDKEIIVEDLSKFDFKKVQISLFSAGSEVAAEYAPKAANSGCIVIDNSSYFRMKENIPLIVPEVNKRILDDFFSNDNRSNIISNPNCSTIQMVAALKPIHDVAIINRIVVSTYQSVSGAGKDAMDELFNQTKDIYSNNVIKKNKFTKQIAFNAIPHIDSFLENGNTKEEQKMIDETKKILDPSIKVAATCVRVPVFVSHAESINIELDSPLSDKEAKNILDDCDYISVVDYRKDEGYVTQVEAAGDNKVYVSRIRKDETLENGINLWVVSDNLRKGAALNAVQIAQVLISEYKDKILI
tara:strand:+ start:468 stop:1511 length:1044 start_codon:yes stop_codon:yes gene_type:complete